jgi:hypothetical protein
MVLGSKSHIGTGLPSKSNLNDSAVVLLGFQLLQRLALDARDHSCDKRARLAHLDHDDERAILVQGGEGSVEIEPQPVERWRAGPSASSKLCTEFTRETWVNACGKLPSNRRDTGSYSSESSPTSLQSEASRSKS